MNICIKKQGNQNREKNRKFKAFIVKSSDCKKQENGEVIISRYQNIFEKAII